MAKGFFDNLKDTFDGLKDKDRLTKTASVTPFLNAVKKNDLDKAREFLKQGIDPNFSTVLGDTPLHIASQRGYHDMALLLIKFKAKVNAQRLSMVKETPLDVAVLRGHTDIITLLVNNGAKINVHKENGWGAIHQAAAEGRADVIKALLSAGADARFLTEGAHGQTALNIALDRKQADAVEALLSQASVANDIHKAIYRQEERVLPLNLMILRRNNKVVKALIKNGVNIDQRDNRGWTPLFYAVQESNFEIMTDLLRQGARAVKTNSQNLANLLHVAANLKKSNDKNSIIETLVKEGVDVNQQTIDGASPLLLAILKEDLKTVEILLQFGARPNMYDASGKPLIFHAMSLQNVAMVDALLEAGADLSLKDRSTGQSVWEYSKYIKNQYIQDALDKYKNVSTPVIKQPFPKAF